MGPNIDTLFGRKEIRRDIMHNLGHVYRKKGAKITVIANVVNVSNSIKRFFPGFPCFYGEPGRREAIA